ncbi:hypothetical protein SCHPADRAFT_947441 [Schizopora paradoxa]|uniref:Uncharacterized protein n=1 Tax=Schizopora paradoxa TaxID=27342 RepID=A0A0H2R0K7_9AGAM|nr:hypothetical protein SCHPADRAFT_947441 [Schizopora paradoxa]
MGKSRNDKSRSLAASAANDTSTPSCSVPGSPTDSFDNPTTRTQPASDAKTTTEKNHVGRPSSFQHHEIKWIRATFDEFDSMVLASTGTQAEKDAIKAWKERKWAELFDKYECSLVRPGQWEKASLFLSPL